MRRFWDHFGLCLVAQKIGTRIEQMVEKWEYLYNKNKKKEKNEDIYINCFQIDSFPTQDNFKEFDYTNFRVLLIFFFKGKKYQYNFWKSKTFLK